ncbi:hypothetical protein PINS_up018325 [Pythium insidiosum]|nr:hypothetical protein PINS_up018325 [Pythium insidiosum]
MRWGAQPAFNGAVSAVAATLSTRDEDIYFHFPSVVPATVNVRRTSGAPSKRRPSTALVGSGSASASASASTSAGNNASSSSVSIASSSSNQPRVPSIRVPVTELTEKVELADDATPVIATTEQFLVCSGRSVHTPRDESPSEATISPPAQRSTTAISSPRAVSGHNNSNNNSNSNSNNNSNNVESTASRQQRTLQRSDSELERIINELRERITQQQQQQQQHLQQQQQLQQQQDSGKKATAAEPHAPVVARKHLKNPVEKVHLLSTSTPPGVSAAGHPLRRQASFNSRSSLALTASQQSLEPSRLGGAAKAELSEFSSEGFRIVSYADGAPPSRKAPQFTSSTALGPPMEEFPLQAERSAVVPQPVVSMMPAKTAASAPSEPISQSAETIAKPPPVAPMRRSWSAKAVAQGPQVSLQGLTLLEFNANSDDDDDEQEQTLSPSPVGPWATDEALSPGPSSAPSSTATVSLSGSASSPALLAITTMAPPECIGELSPRSRLLWLSECSFEEPPMAAHRVDQRSTKTMLRLWEMLRPGATRSSETAAAKSIPRAAATKAPKSHKAGALPRSSSAKPRRLGRRASQGAEEGAKSRDGPVLRRPSTATGLRNARTTPTRRTKQQATAPTISR